MNRQREREVQAVTVLVCVTILVLAVMGMLASAYEWTWVISVLKLCAWMAIGMMLFVCGWHMGAMWQHEHGGRKCGARSVDEEEESSKVRECESSKVSKEEFKLPEYTDCLKCKLYKGNRVCSEKHEPEWIMNAMRCRHRVAKEGAP